MGEPKYLEKNLWGPKWVVKGLMRGHAEDLRVPTPDFLQRNPHMFVYQEKELYEDKMDLAPIFGPHNVVLVPIPLFYEATLGRDKQGVLHRSFECGGQNPRIKQGVQKMAIATEYRQCYNTAHPGNNMSASSNHSIIHVKGGGLYYAIVFNPFRADLGLEIDRDGKGFYVCKRLSPIERERRIGMACTIRERDSRAGVLYERGVAPASITEIFMEMEANDIHAPLSAPQPPSPHAMYSAQLEEPQLEMQDQAPDDPVQFNAGKNVYSQPAEQGEYVQGVLAAQEDGASPDHENHMGESAVDMQFRSLFPPPPVFLHEDSGEQMVSEEGALFVSDLEGEGFMERE